MPTSSPPPVDGIVSPIPGPPDSPVIGPPAVGTVPSASSIKNGDPLVRSHLILRRAFVLLLGAIYVIYALWSAYLLLVLPDVTGVHDALIAQGMIVAIGIGAAFLLMGLFALLRIGSAEIVDLPRRRLAAVKVIGVILPALVISGTVPVLIRREPTLSVSITSPEKSEDIIAPLSVTYSAEQAVAVLKRRNLTPEKFVWDFDGDGKMNAETTDPSVVAAYERPGSYTLSLAIFLRGGQVRRISRRLVIDKALFSVDPAQPLMDEPSRLSISNLVPKAEDLEQVEWDFDSNGEVDLITKELDVTHTFYGEGQSKVTVKITLKSKAVQTYSRVIDVIASLPLPFPVTFAAEPEHLVGPPPFGAVFTVKTSEPLRVILWSFGDGAEARGERVGHTFTTQGVYPVTAELRSQSGPVAKITKVVRVTPELQLSDLTFSGTPEVHGSKISGEIPVTVNLRPRTTMPLIEFFWEVPEASTVGSTKETVQASYRKEGIYTLWLIGQDPDGRVLRKPLTVEVLPVSSSVTIQMDPDGGAAPLTVRLDASETVIPNEQISGFEWTFSDEPQNATHQQGAQVSHTFTKPGTYDITTKVLTTSGKEFSGRKTIVVRAPVIASCIAASRTEGFAPLGIQFNSDCSTVGAKATYVWDFGDGFTSDQRNPIHDFQQPGVYSVTLTVRDGDTQAVSDPLTISVQP